MRASLAEIVNGELKGLDTIADEAGKANAACLVHLRGIAKEMVQTKKRVEEYAKMESFSNKSPYHNIWTFSVGAFINASQQKMPDINLDELPTEFREFMLDLRQLDKDESETLQLIDVMKASCMRRVIRARFDGRGLDDIVKIAKACSPHLFPLPKHPHSLKSFTFRR